MGKAANQGPFISGSAVTLLCFVSGATDVLSYLTLGRIFTSAMTGCTALLVIAIINTKYRKALRAGLSLFSYTLGGAVATLLQPRAEDQANQPFALRRLLIAEALLLAAYCIVAALAHHPAKPAIRDPLVVLSALAMGIQAVAARQTHEKGITTVVLNITITSIIVALTKGTTGRGHHPMTRHTALQLTVLASYATGAALTAGALTEHWFPGDLLPLAGILATLTLYFRKSNQT